MRPGLKALRQALDAAPDAVRFFLRDDDAGWDDARLFALLDCTARAGVPIDLAVIPQATEAGLASSLCMRIDAAPGTIGVHQHGFEHVSHESVQRKCEFGDSRELAAQRRDLCAGRERLQQNFGARLDAIFTPPWNRCCAATPALLAVLGYSALSRDRGAPPQLALPELPVDVDWCRHFRAVDDDGLAGVDRVGFDLAKRVRSGAPVGLMLHHAEMDARHLADLSMLLQLTRERPNARWLSMRELIAERRDPGADWTPHHHKEFM